MVHMDLALEEGGESQGQGHHSTEAEERIREVDMWKIGERMKRIVWRKQFLLQHRLIMFLDHTGPSRLWSSQVWAHNLEDEFKEICRIVADFNYVAMDTEFPGVVARPIGEFKSTSDYQYQVWSHTVWDNLNWALDYSLGGHVNLCSCWDAMLTYWKSSSLASPSLTRKEAPLRGFAHGR